MDKTNYILKVEMSDEEATTFSHLTPLLGISVTGTEANFIANILGYKTARNLFERGFPNNPYLQNAYLVLVFLYLSRADKDVFLDFWDRIIFTDKDVEKKAKLSFNIPDDSDTLSSLQLELMWMLETDRDELDNLK